MKYAAKHRKKHTNRQLDLAIRAFIVTVCAILTAVAGYYVAFFFDGKY
ncbi:MAG: hypothetical protein IKZ47_07555 [Clostridia bacterium]|nr:hypothetical protein [Clostridia bacterium]